MGESFSTLQDLVCGLLLELSLGLAGQGLEVVILAPKVTGSTWVSPGGTNPRTLLIEQMTGPHLPGYLGWLGDSLWDTPWFAGFIGCYFRSR